MTKNQRKKAKTKSIVYPLDKLEQLDLKYLNHFGRAQLVCQEINAKKQPKKLKKFSLYPCNYKQRKLEKSSLKLTQNLLDCIVPETIAESKILIESVQLKKALQFYFRLKITLANILKLNKRKVILSQVNKTLLLSYHYEITNQIFEITNQYNNQ
jgi:hypothetical protein